VCARLFSDAARPLPQTGQTKPCGQRRANRNAAQLVSSEKLAWNSLRDRALATGRPLAPAACGWPRDYYTPYGAPWDSGISLDSLEDLEDIRGLEDEKLAPSAEILTFPGCKEGIDIEIISKDPIYRIGNLDSAINVPISVKSNDRLAIAITIMLANDFSQLPIMTNERDVKGVITWASIGGRLAFSPNTEIQNCEVRECMDEPCVIAGNTSLFDAIGPIVRNQYALITDSTKRITGIVTSSDLSEKFRELAEPFLLIEEIEKHIRSLIARSGLSREQLIEAVGTPSANDRNELDPENETVG
jgi:CBS domain-containing protein